MGAADPCPPAGADPPMGLPSLCGPSWAGDSVNRHEIFGLRRHLSRYDHPEETERPALPDCRGFPRSLPCGRTLLELGLAGLRGTAGDSGSDRAPVTSSSSSFQNKAVLRQSTGCNAHSQARSGQGLQAGATVAT